MSGIEHDIRRELHDLIRPIGEKRRGNHEETRAFLSPVLQQVKQRQHLHGLAESHIIGKAHAELQGVQK